MIDDVGIELVERRVASERGALDQHIDPPPSRQQLADGALRVAGSRDVTGNTDRLTELAQLCRGIRDCLRRARHHCDPGTEYQERLGAPTADRASSPGDEHGG